MITCTGASDEFAFEKRSVRDLVEGLERKLRWPFRFDCRSAGGT